MLPPCLLRYHLLRAQEPCILYCNTSKKMTIRMSRKKKDEKGWWCVWSNVGLWRRNTVPIITKTCSDTCIDKPSRLHYYGSCICSKDISLPSFSLTFYYLYSQNFQILHSQKRVGWNHRVIGRNEFIFRRVKEKMMMNMNELNEHLRQKSESYRHGYPFRL